MTRIVGSAHSAKRRGLDIFVSSAGALLFKPIDAFTLEDFEEIVALENSMNAIDALRQTYDAYNRRNLAQALANLSPDVDWDDGQGHMLHGPQAVASHWTDEWRTADARVVIQDAAQAGDRIELQITLDTKSEGGERSKKVLGNAIELDNGRILAMRIV